MTETSTIAVRINGAEMEIPMGLSVTEVLGWLDLNPSLVVVERNREILDRKEHDEVRVAQGDVLELVHFVGGG